MDQASPVYPVGSRPSSGFVFHREKHSLRDNLGRAERMSNMLIIVTNMYNQEVFNNMDRGGMSNGIHGGIHRARAGRGPGEDQGSGGDAQIQAVRSCGPEPGTGGRHGKEPR